MIRKFALVATAAALMVACGGTEENMENKGDAMDSTKTEMMEQVNETPAATTPADTTKMDTAAATPAAPATEAAPAAH